MKMKNESSNQFIVEKTDARVIMMLDLGKPKKMECLIRLNLTSRSGSGPETIKEFLEYSEEFIPVRMGSSKKFSILNTGSIIYLLEKEKLNICSTVSYELLLKGKIHLRAENLMNLPKIGGRFQDVLLQDEKYADFLFKGSRIYIQKKMIIKGDDNE